MSAAPPLRQDSQWYIGPKSDLLIGCGLWSIPFILLTHYLNLTYGAVLAFAFYVLSFLCNYPHYMATIYRAYGSKADFEKYRFFTIYITALMVGTAAIVHLSHTLFGDKVNLVPYFVTFYLLWSPYHYTGQNFGLTMMFARKRGVQPTLLERNLLQYGYVASYLVMLVSVQSSTGGGDAHLLRIGGWLAKQTEHMGIIVNTIRVVFLGIFLVFTSYAVTRWVRQVGLRKAFPFVALAMTQGVWFLIPSAYEILGYAAPAVYYSTGILAFMHCAQYLWINRFYAKKEAEAGLRGGGVWSPWKYYAILILGGIALFVPAPWLVSRTLGFDMTESFLIFVSLVNIHHFMLDGAIWKLRDGRIAQLLLGNSSVANNSASNAASEYLTGVARWLIGRSMLARFIRYAGVTGLVGIAVVDITYQYATRQKADFESIFLAKKLNPNDTKSYVRHAELLAEAGSLEGAIEQVRLAIQINPYSPGARRMYPTLLAQLGDATGNPKLFELAQSELRVLPMLFSPDFGTLFLWGQLSIRMGDATEAINALEEARVLDPQRADTYVALGDAYLGVGSFEKAAQAYNYYILRLQDSGKTDPETVRRSLIAGLKMADALIALDKGDDAAGLYPRIIQASLAMGDAGLASQGAMRFADLRESAGDIGGALAIYRDAVSLGRDSGDRDVEGRTWFNFAQFLDDHATDRRLPAVAFAVAEDLLVATPDLKRLAQSHRERTERGMDDSARKSSQVDRDALSARLLNPEVPLEVSSAPAGG